MPGAVHPTLAPYLSRLEGAPGSSSSLALPGHWAKARKLTLLYHEWAKGSARAGGFSWVMLALCVCVCTLSGPQFTCLCTGDDDDSA